MRKEGNIDWAEQEALATEGGAKKLSTSATKGPIKTFDLQELNTNLLKSHNALLEFLASSDSIAQSPSDT